MNLFAILEFTCVGLSFLILTSYHIWFIYSVYTVPTNSTTGFTAMLRKEWVKQTRLKNDGDILCVQTLRNWILVSVFLASVAITFGFSVLQFSIQMISSKESEYSDYLFSISESEHYLLGIKALTVMTCNFISFFAFTQAIRYFNHVGFAIQVHVLSDFNEELVTFDTVRRMLNFGAKFFTIGIRGFYFAIPFVLWFVSPYAMLASTIILVISIYYTDYPHRDD